MSQFNTLEPKIKAYADARATVSEIVKDLTEAIDALNRDALPGLKRAMTRATEKHDALLAQIAASPDLFKKPKSMNVHGVKCGFKKGVGGIQFSDAATVVALIKKKLPDQVDALIKTKEAPIKDALAQLPVDQLKRIGCTVVSTGEMVYAQTTDSAIDKLVDKLLGKASQTDEEGEA